MQFYSGRSTRYGWLLAMLAGAVLAGCGGGGGSGEPGGTGGTGGAGTTSYPSGTVSVTARDVFGEPVARAEVSFYAEGGNLPTRLTNLEGRLEIERVRAGPISIYAWHNGSADSGYLSSGIQTSLQANEQLAVDLTLVPAPDLPFIGIGRSAGDAEPDPEGRVLEFSLPVYLGHDEPDWEWNSLIFTPCFPDAANDDQNPFGDCVVGPAGFDAEYTPANDGKPLSAPLRSAPPSAPLRYVTLLLDQSAEMARHDPFDARLYGARYAASAIGDDGRIAVAGFAADDPSGSEVSTLEREPLTVYPTNNPQFLPPSDELSATINTLGEREGGIAPLYAATSEGLDFVAARVPEGERRAAFLLTDGRDDTCGDAADCATARQAVVDKAIASAVELVSIGTLMTDDADTGGARDIALLVEDTNGHALWVNNRTQLSAAFHAALDWQSGSGATLVARFRLESPAPGAFASGHTVYGRLTYEVCPWDCYSTTVPVAIRIP